jgi:hypothetical protein
MDRYALGLADGATEIHKLDLDREVLKGAKPGPDLFPSQHVPRLRAAATGTYGDVYAQPTAADSESALLGAGGGVGLPGRAVR